MTLVYAYEAPNQKLVVAGDLMLSRPSADEEQPPTRKAPFIFHETQMYRPSGLRQKLAIVAPNVVVGWSGSSVQASSFVAYLRQKFGGKKFDHLAIIETLEAYPEADQRDISAFITVRTELGLCTFCLNTRGFPIGRIPFGVVLGSGTGAYLEWAERNVNAGGYNELSEPLMFLGSAMAQQFSSGHGLDDLWGGGIQIVLENEDGFYFQDKLLLRSWVLMEAGDTLSFGRGPFFYLFYEDDALFVCRIGGGDGGDFDVAPRADFKRPPALPYGVHAPDVIFDVVHKDGENGHPGTVSVVTASPSVLLHRSCFAVTVSDEETARVALMAQGEFSTSRRR